MRRFTWERVLLVLLTLSCVALAIALYFNGQDQNKYFIHHIDRIAALEGAVKRLRQADNTRFDTLVALQLRLRATNVDWTPSADGKLQFRLVTDFDRRDLGMPLFLLFQMRNAGDKPLTVLHPELKPWEFNLKIDGERTDWQESTRLKRIPVPVILLPGEVIESRILFNKPELPSLNLPGDFTATLDYYSGDANNEGIWAGQIGPIKATWHQNDLPPDNHIGNR